MHRTRSNMKYANIWRKSKIDTHGGSREYTLDDANTFTLMKHKLLRHTHEWHHYAYYNVVAYFHEFEVPEMYGVWNFWLRLRSCWIYSDSALTPKHFKVLDSDSSWKLQSELSKGSGYRCACGSWNLKTYSYATCDVTVTHDESAVGLVEMK